ncbi:MAG: 4-alpha-glucanotransferase [Nocardioides sp.]
MGAATNGAFRDPARYPVALASPASARTTRRPSPRGGRRSRPGSATPCAGSPRSRLAEARRSARSSPPRCTTRSWPSCSARAARLVLLLMQDVLGVHERVNTPSTVGPHNWTWRLPADIEALATDEAVRAKLAMVRGEVERARR